MRDRPAAATIWRPLIMPRRQPKAANTHTMPAVTTNVGRPDDGHDRHAQDEPEDHAGRGDDGGGEDLPGGAVAEQAHATLQSAVEGAADDPADDVADGCADEEPDHPAGAEWIGVVADLVAEQRPEEDDDEPDALDEDHAVTAGR